MKLNLHTRPHQNTLVEGVDFYYENGLMVFTKAYHQKKGYCCKNQCRHCPWDYKKINP